MFLENLYFHFFLTHPLRRKKGSNSSKPNNLLHHTTFLEGLGAKLEKEN